MPQSDFFNSKKAESLPHCMFKKTRLATVQFPTGHIQSLSDIQLPTGVCVCVCACVRACMIKAGKRGIH